MANLCFVLDNKILRTDYEQNIVFVTNNNITKINYIGNFDKNAFKNYNYGFFKLHPYYTDINYKEITYSNSKPVVNADPVVNANLYE